MIKSLKNAGIVFGLFLNFLELIIAFDDAYFAICLFVRDELDLSEWIEYHHRLGVDKFYIYDHNSTSPLVNSILPHVHAGYVDYKFIPDVFLQPLVKTNNICLHSHKHDHHFIGFIDSDEFIVLNDKSKLIPEILQNYENVGGVVLNWKIFGSSGHIFVLKAEC